jgi:hypothetical protein
MKLKKIGKFKISYHSQIPKLRNKKKLHGFDTDLKQMGIPQIKIDVIYNN